MSVRVLHLYPHGLGINGDGGNVECLRVRARWRGLEIEVTEHEPGDPVPDSVDLVHIGSGPVSAQRAVHADVVSIASTLRGLAADGVPFLAVAAGWQLLGRELVDADGARIEGAAVYPSRAVLGRERAVGEALVRARGGVLAGFENHSAATTLLEGAEALGEVLSGVGNRSREHDPGEGVRRGDLIGTHLHGPVLPANPVLADELLAAALRHAGVDAELPETVETARADEYARHAGEAIAARLGVRL